MGGKSAVCFVYLGSDNIGRPAHCKICNKEIRGDDVYKNNNKSYCKECYDKVHAESEDYKTLINMICEYFECEEPTGLIITQIKRYKKDYDLSYAAIGYTLWYVKNIIGDKFNSKYGIYQVKNEYKNAEKYFTEQQINSEKASNFKEKERVVKLKPKSKKNNYLIDLDKFVEGK